MLCQVEKNQQEVNGHVGVNPIVSQDYYLPITCLGVKVRTFLRIFLKLCLLVYLNNILIVVFQLKER